jgi:hypothetical protein
MKPGTVIVDVAVDQGGCIETCQAHDHADPTYVVDGVLHYCVANMPGAVPRTSTFALTTPRRPGRRSSPAWGRQAPPAGSGARHRGERARRRCTHQGVAEAFEPAVADRRRGIAGGRPRPARRRLDRRAPVLGPRSSRRRWSSAAAAARARALAGAGRGDQAMRSLAMSLPRRRRIGCSSASRSCRARVVRRRRSPAACCRSVAQRRRGVLVPRRTADPLRRVRAEADEEPRGAARRVPAPFSVGAPRAFVSAILVVVPFVRFLPEAHVRAVRLVPHRGRALLLAGDLRRRAARMSGARAQTLRL